MIVVTTDTVPGYRVDAVYGEVTGVTVRARNAFANWTAGVRSTFGGEVPEFTEALLNARQEAVGRMVYDAQQRGANAVLGMRFETSEINGWTQICAYGTAAVTLPLAQGENGATGQSAYMARQSSQHQGNHAPIDFQAQQPPRS
ncbi:YbjQ family protein [Nesterenkonia flava]|uniref:UPF0145 protein RH857_07355 n=1 Tax=Nesterenkonia flava TaxID=469799 RepID=A0ABU1FTG9_9MICC|nr:YbjQ family protein [Nesterenkonia flava]MDR5711950.1 YbjQ family protein [Nesterenkonia flava]